MVSSPAIARRPVTGGMYPSVYLLLAKGAASAVAGMLATDVCPTVAAATATV